ncbi:alpha-L-fucosidase [Puniceicoccales bacterium CK1056]|uniref:alpha-L-fucosidase n=2 Tax=Oceanipulchritudo coccoides TaxID=2706888 RepID=A0A6B2M139_9BACT|nr:alpha-L-fucosidase [Oceanipulchritudo coccoides]
MDAMWGDSTVKLRAENSARGQLFEEGNYAMFIHWGLYSHLGNKVNGKTYYGIGEWIMSDRMAGIPIGDYKQLAEEFNPLNFDAEAIVQLAKDAGMKYIVITSKHHDGFAMYDSEVSDFDIVDSTPWGHDPMKELSDACQKAGLGFGFYYSHNQDWTYPGGHNGPDKKENGESASFDDYFREKCLPQVEEITTQYGPIALVWFDTPGEMPKHYVEQLVEVVRRNQPNALVSGRAGHGLGDYQTLGDMEVPHHNIDGMWESVDTTNNSWGYAWYDENWKSPREILNRLISTVARGGTYMLNIGPRGDGSVPVRASRVLRVAGQWIQSNPQVIYRSGPSPWGHALPWGDVTTNGNTLSLCIFDWMPLDRLYLPGLKSEIKSAHILTPDGPQAVPYSREGNWTIFTLPSCAPDLLVSVIEVELAGPPDVDQTFGLDPLVGTEILAEFAEVDGAEKSSLRWMEKFGEWVRLTRIHEWSPDSTASWEVDVIHPGEYLASLSYAGKGRIVWGVSVEGGEHIQNEQDSSHNYEEYPIGWIHFPEPGRYRIHVSCLEDENGEASLKSIRLVPIM